MRFIPKQKEILTESILKNELKEAEANPLEKAVENSSEDEAYKQAILKAIGSETAADVEYSQILSLESKVSEDLKNIFHDTIIDIRNEEIKHIAQLTEKVKQLPDMKDAFEAGEKEAESGKDIKEAVQKERTYDAENIKLIIDQYLKPDTYENDEIEDIFIKYPNELTAEEVDKILENIVNLFNLSSEQLHDIEIKIVETSNPIIERQNNFKSDIEDDINTLNYVKDSLETQAAVEQFEKVLPKIIEYLKNLSYDGNIDTGWTKDHADKFNDNYKRNIIK